MQVFNLKNQKGKRQSLRKQQTKAEEILWKELRRKTLGFKFRRQFGIGPYIIDFYCPQLKFAIELDGDVHAFEKIKQKDAIRDKFLKDLDITIKRYWNHEIYKEIDSVLEEIFNICQQLNELKIKENSEHPQSPPKTRGRIKRGLM